VALIAVAVTLDRSYELAAEYPVGPTFALVGALIATRRPRHPIGWLYLSFGLVASVVDCSFAYAKVGTRPGAELAASISAHLWHPGFGLIIWSLLLFPDGHFLSRGWRWFGRIVAAVCTALLLTGIFEGGYQRTLKLDAQPLFDVALANTVFALLLGITALSMLGGAAALLARLFCARGEQRQQVKWHVYTVAVVALSIPLGVFTINKAIGVYLFPLIPASAALAILRHRLFDIDVVIKRTLIYGGLTAILGGAYALGVLLLQLVLNPSSDLAIAGSTLAVAALFRPVKNRVQEFVDRRFYRASYDAQRTVEAFGARLRDELSLETLTDELQAVVRDTMHPSHVTVWLR
jgi:hypothetical protein